MTTAKPPSTPVTGRRRYAVLLVCGLPFLMMTLDATVVNVALPSIAKDLDASLQSLQWIVSAYILMLAAFVVTGGMLADRFGRRRIVVLGVIIFTLGSALCGMATDEYMLIASRAFQAIGGLLISPSTLAIVTNVFVGQAERAKALGWWALFASAGLAIGPTLGGVLVETLGWRSIFWVNIGPGIIAVVLLLLIAPASRAAQVKRFDPVGQALLVLFVFPLVFVIIQLSSLGWSSPLIIGAAVLCVASVIALVLYERRQEEALIPFSLFSSRAFTGAILTLMLGVLGSGAVGFSVTLFLQNYRGLSPTQAGLLILPMALATMVAAPQAGRWVAQGRARMVLIVAAIMIIAAGAGFWITMELAVLFIIIPFVLMGLGFGALNDPVNVVAISELPDGKAGLAASIISMSRQIGQVLGVAIAGALLATGLGADMKSGFDKVVIYVWILLILAGLGILIINALPQRHPAASRQKSTS